MTFRQLGENGPSVSVAGLGCNTFGATLAPEGVPALVSAALDAGITFFDTADVYGGTFGLSEELLGTAITGHRDEIVLATKFGAGAPDGVAPGSRGYVRESVESSLRRLGTD